MPDSGTQSPLHPPAPGPSAQSLQASMPLPRADAVRDGIGAALVLIALVLPWNIQFGLGVPGNYGWLFALLFLGSLGPWAAVALTRRRLADPAAAPESVTRMRLLLNLPYLALVAATVVFAVIGAIVLGGTGDPAPGVGPGAWFGLAGALLCAQPVFGIGTSSGHRARGCRLVTNVFVGLAVLAALFNVFWRVRFVVPGIFDGDAVGQNLTVVAAAVLYAAAALTPILLVARWLRTDAEPDRLATLLLGGATLIAGALVWLLPAGRQIDGFHGIAQNTGTAGVGYEGYLAWVAVAAIAGPLAMLRAGSWRAPDAAAWRGAVRRSLQLIAAWAAVSAVLRITDLVLAGVLEVPELPYVKTALMAVDVLTAVLAGWLVLNGFARLPKMAARVLLFGLVALTVCRVALGVRLSPRVDALVTPERTAVFGNDQFQQITSTFDVVLCVLAAAVAVTALTVLDRRPPALPVDPAVAADRTEGTHGVQAELSQADEVQADAARPAGAAPKIAAAPPATPRIAAAPADTGATPEDAAPEDPA
ncbi:hypothetical protein MFAL_23990 [Mycolicibacterium fallax]|nr:hypothetical protein MFAL_23990 [Mycolicibacterium fallax]